MPSKRELVSVSAKEFFARSPKSSKRPNHATETSENTYRITFGKHKGKPLNQIPASYIEWLVHNRIYESRRDLKEALDAAGVLNNQDDSGAGDKPTPRAAASTVSEDQGGWSVNITAKQLRDALPPDWNEALGEEVMAKGAWKDLAQFLAEESFRGMRIYPNFSQVFRALELCPFNKTKVVILGQDPYHGPRQAEGMSFSVPRGTPIPSSLKNIYKELKADIPDVSIPTHGHLAHWAEQGVLLLNAALTVRAGDANGHQQRGWEVLTSAMVSALSESRKDIVFLLWGRWNYCSTLYTQIYKIYMLYITCISTWILNVIIPKGTLRNGGEGFRNRNMRS
ncbi:hypothetical protein AAMO2058_000982200 [Amorphochlora amoebiformis]